MFAKIFYNEGGFRPTVSLARNIRIDKHNLKWFVGFYCLI